MELKNLPKFKFKNDAYAKRRGKPAMLAVSCVACNKFMILYQKDGPGPLLRCYLDRIHYPADISSRQDMEFCKKTFPYLECQNCKVVIGSPIIYEKENRPAYHMRPGFFSIKKLY